MGRGKKPPWSRIAFSFANLAARWRRDLRLVRQYDGICVIFRVEHIYCILLVFIGETMST